MEQWKRFNFVDKEAVLEVEGKKKVTPRALRDFEPCCSCGGRGRLVFGDKKGRVRVVDTDMRQTHGVQAFSGRVVAVAQPAVLKADVIVALGHDDPETPTLKCYRLNPETGAADAIRSFPVAARGGSAASSATCMAVTADLSQIAVGTEQGSVFLIGGDILKREFVTVLQTKGPMVTGLHYLERSDPVSLFVVTETSIATFYIRNKNFKQSLDAEAGANLGCCVLDERSQQLLVGRERGRERGLFWYTQDDRGTCIWGFENDRMHWYANYLCLIRREKNRSSDSVTLYDLKNKFIAFNESFETVSTVVALTTWKGREPLEWGPLHVVTKTGKVFRLSEKNLTNKVAVLKRRHLYDLAIRLAQSEGRDLAYVMQIRKQSADHKKDKGDYAGAMRDYLQTIGYVEPSYVIRQFLDAQRISHLTEYLESLHDWNDGAVVNNDHTTLLLKCYTKLKQPEKLERFIKGPVTSFDVEAAIHVCHQAGYYAQALYLSRKCEHHDWYLRILVEDLPDNKDRTNLTDAAGYIAKLDAPSQKRFLLHYGTRLMSVEPELTTKTLVALCGNATPREARPPATTFMQLFVGYPRNLLEFLQSVVEEVPQDAPMVYNTLLELYLTIHLEPPLRRDRDGKVRPRQARKSAVADGKAPEVLSAEQEKERSANEARAMQLLRKQTRYDLNHALVVAKKYRFERGMILLYEKLRMYSEILQYYMQTDKHDKLIRACRRHGTADPDLWVQALKYFAEKPDCKREIVSILDEIEKSSINLAPLMVVNILSRGRDKPFSVIKDYIISILQREQDAIQKDEQGIARCQQETEDMRKEIVDLTTKPTTFMPSRDLMLPAVHFLCRHAYHEQVIANRECPKCAPEYKRVMDIKDEGQQSKNQHDQFFKMLEGSNDGFGVVAEYFGRGILEKGTKGRK